MRWDALWPQGERVDLEPLPHAVDEVSLERVVADAFHDPDPRRPCRTRAVAIVHAGRIVAECYAPGFPLHMPLIGWSMAKSVVNALVGILVRQGRLALHHDRLLPEWCQPGDGRAKITLGQLLRMNSGLAFSENYRNPLDGVLPMLFNSADGGSYAAEKPLCVEPGSQWYYSSGTTSILCRVLRDALAGSDEEYQTFPRRALFDRIGMSTAVLEPDASGTFVGSSFMYASARDWARLGLLYLQDGVWHGERILPEGWVDYSRGCGQSERGRYGAHFWLELPAFGRTTEKPRAILPRDAFHAVGYEGQYLSIIPSMKLVVVRLGLTPRMEAWNHERFLARIVRSIA